jgi:uncharacterized membrane protein
MRKLHKKFDVAIKVWKKKYFFTKLTNNLFAALIYDNSTFMYG